MRIFSKDRTCSSLRGFGLTEVLLAAALIGVMSLLVASLLNNLNAGNQRAQEAATLAALRNEASPILKDLPTWLEKMRVAYPLLGDCIPVSGAPTGCPTVTSATDPEILLKYSGRIITNQALLSMSGTPLAGVEGSPVILDSAGKACVPPAANCRFQVFGYLVQNASNITFVYKIVQIRSQTQSVVPWKPILVELNVGLNWTDAVGSCPGTQYMVGMGSDRKPICLDMPVLSCMTLSPPSGSIVLCPSGYQRAACWGESGDSVRPSGTNGCQNSNTAPTAKTYVSCCQLQYP